MEHVKDDGTDNNSDKFGDGGDGSVQFRHALQRAEPREPLPCHQFKKSPRLSSKMHYYHVPRCVTIDHEGH